MPGLVEDLSEEIDDVQSKLNSWSYRVVTAACDRKENHIVSMEQHRASIKALERRKASLRQQADELQQRLQREGAEEAELKGQLEAVQREESTLPAQIEALQARLQAELDRVTQREGVLEQQNAERRRRLDALRRSADMYRSRLGLAFEQQSDGDAEELRIVFTHIDAADPQRPFAFGVYVDNDDMYAVRSCSPPVPGLDVLLAALNEDRSFSAFVRAMRREFQAVA